MGFIAASPYTRLFWNEYLLAPQSSEYNMIMDQSLDGAVDISRLQLAVQELAQNYILFHHVLNDCDNGLRWVASDKAITLELLSEDTDIAALVATPFNLTQGPLCRFYLIDRGAQRYSFIIVLHHVLIDGLSGNEFFDVIASYYNQQPTNFPAAQTAAQLNQLYRGYEDHIGRLQSEFTSPRFWGELLSDCAPQVELPYLLSPAAHPLNSGEVRFSLTTSEWRNLKKSIKHASHFLIFKTLWALLIARQSESQKVHIGYPVAPEGGARLCSGAQVNTAVFPLQLAPQDTFDDLYLRALAYTKRLKASGKLRHTLLPTEQILSHSPVKRLNVNFTQAYFKDSPLRLNGCRVSVNHRFNIDLAGSELLFEYQQAEERFDFRIRYRKDLFADSQIGEMAEQYLALLRAALTQPQRPVASLPYLTERQQHSLLQSLNAGEDLNPIAAATLLTGFSAAVRDGPHRLALRDEREAIDYAELDRRSTEWAQRLRAAYLHIYGQQMPADTLIPLFLGRSARAVVAILAILKAGAAYVPLDAQTPAQRLAWILQDVGRSIVVTESALHDTLVHSAPDHPCLLIDDQPAACSPQEAALPGLDGRQLAYVIYTSGTTGQPKGVLCEHRGAVNMIDGHTRRILANEPERLNGMQFASLAFDAHVFEIFMALSNGHSLSVASEHQRLDLSLLIEQMGRWQIHFCFLPPALLTTQPDFLQPLRYLCLGGESTSQAVLDHYLASGLQVFNLYGPTEASVSVCLNAYRGNGARNIGSVIANLHAYVVDEHLSLMPIGAEGELCLAGVGLARGYLRQPELTASAFIDNPFSQSAEYARLYRTGDRVRRSACGELEYCGRKDQQVKINGYRIELEEIESVMRALPVIAAAVVVADRTAGSRLLAWYVPAAGRALSPQQVGQQLEAKLPYYMVPAAMMAIDAIPLTLSQKIDYRALPQPMPVDRTRPYRLPGSRLEQQLLDLLNGLLSTQAGIDDHFYRLGGNSILAIKLCHDINQQLGASVSPLILSQHPTMASLAGYLAQQRQHPGTGSIPASGRSSAPLSYQQSSLWFMQQLAPDATHYLSPVLLRLPAAVDCTAFIHSLQALVSRHQVLRSLIEQDQHGAARQRVTEQVLSVPLFTLTAAAFSAELQQALQQGFDLTRDIPLRAALYRYPDATGEIATSCLLIFHHIAFDGWSLNVLLQELNALYDRAREPSAAPPAALPLQYLDYALWQQGQEEEGSSAEDRAFWQRLLADAQQLPLATDFVRPAVFDNAGASYEITLPGALVTALERLAREEGVSLHAVCLSVFTLLLARYTAQDDVLLGTPLTNRSQPELEGLIGFFVNTLPLRHRVDNQMRVAGLIQQLAATTQQIQQHQSLSLEALITSLSLPRDLSRHPLFQVTFALEEAATEAPGSADFGVEDLSGYEHTAKFDLSLTLRKDPRGTTAHFNFATSLFSSSTVVQLADYFVLIAQQMVSDKNAVLQNITLAAAEPAQAPPGLAHLRPFSYDFERSLHHDFMRNARRTPQAVAVIDSAGEMTYAELCQAALILATQLRQQTELQGEAIAILLDKGRRQPIAMLAALMCGKAFLPMDKSWPAQRCLSVMAQAGINTLLSDGAWQAEEINAITIGAEGQAQGLAQPERLLPAAEAEPGSLAYIIFTSGSTGTPKGVAIEHRSVVNMIEGTNRYFGIGNHDRTLALSALSFDLAVYDIFGALSAGGAVVMPAESERTRPACWHRLIIAHRVTVWLSAPALLELLLGFINGPGGPSGPAPALRVVMVGGDWIATSLPARCRQWAVDCRFCSAGGATESAVFSILYEVPPQPVLSVSIPYGKAMPHARCYILDSALRPLAAGVTGEIFIAGEGLARGYYADEPRTAERFFWHPQLQERVYRTGDAGRLMNDGNIEFLGRIDQQLKINGYRIEPGEIENVILTYPGLSACCVVLTGPPQPCLAAYLVAGKPVEVSALSQYLLSKLPHYMIPQAFIQLEQLPLTENGKIARKALPLPQVEQRAFVDAEGEWERACAAIWCALLQRPQVSVADNFFSLGGNSLLAIQCCYQISRRFQRECTLSELGQYPTIRALCHYLGSRGDSIEPTLIPALHRQSYPLSSSQLQLWFIENLNGGSNLYHVPMLFRLSEDADLTAYRQALQAIVARHQVLRSTVCQQPGLAATSRLSDRSLEVSFVRLNADDWQPRLLQDIDRPFNLAADIPLRASLYQIRQPDNGTLIYSLVVVHHMSFDGWSQKLLMQELAALYQGYRTGQPAALPALPLQYGDYASWQQLTLLSASGGQWLDFWQQQLEEWQRLELPLDFVRPPQFDHQGANYRLRLPPSLVAQAEHFAQQQGVTAFALYLSAFNLLLSYLSGQQDILIGTPFANRPGAEAGSLIGFFVNTLPLRSRIDDSVTLAGYVQTVFKQTLAAQKHQGLPLEKLIEQLQVPRDLSRHPLFQVLFALEDSTQAAPTPGWLAEQSLFEHYQVAKFDLTLSIHRESIGVEAIFNYATALFSEATVACLAGYYQLILEQIVTQSELRINQLRLISAAEVARQRASVQQSLPTYDFEQAIHQQFMQQARRQPQAVAIIDAAGELSYGALYDAALTLSLQLRQHTDMSGETVAVLVDKGRAQIIAVLAIVMAGKAYLPLDGSWPESRRQQVLLQAQTTLVISSHDWAESGPARLLRIDPAGVVAALPAPQPGEPLLPAPDRLAYVIFTSGSTGAPKGVAIEHRGAVNSIIDTLNQLGLGPQDRGLALSALSFDISVFDIFGLLSAGGTLVMPSEAQRYRPDAWHRLMVEQGVTFWNAAPSVMTVLVEYLESAGLPAPVWPGLRNVILVGEVIAKTLPARIRRWGDGCRIVSAGGATESSIWSILYEIPDAPLSGPSVPYGKAMAHQRFYVLDRHGHLLPPCLPGEQYIAGAGVARGYFGNPSLTQERFILHPELGERLYRTGDLGRYLPEGNLEFLGRTDFQVKINGYRVELAEVETVALASGAIKSCCALVCHDRQQAFLALYYVSEQPLVEAELLAFLSTRLPLYMIPTALISLPALPYSSSGKLDRKALPAARASEQQGYVAPTTPLERQLCSLWEKTLKRSPIGMTDDFFRSGGTSIMAIAVCMTLSEWLQTPVPVVRLFQCRTLKNLLAERATELVTPLRPKVSGLPTLWTIHPALVGAEVFQPLAERLQGKMNVYGVDNYNLYHRPLISSLADLANCYLDEMIANGLLRQPVQILGWSLGGLIALEIAARLEARGIDNVSLYLLDSFYRQPTESVSPRTLLSALGLSGEASGRAMAVVEVEEALSQASLSRPLRSTRVTLFKAQQANPKLPEGMMNRLLALPDNGLRDACDQLVVIPLACHHHNIIECDEAMIRAILAGLAE